MAEGRHVLENTTIRRLNLFFYNEDQKLVADSVFFAGKMENRDELDP